MTYDEWMAGERAAYADPAWRPFLDHAAPFVITIADDKAVAETPPNASPTEDG